MTLTADDRARLRRRIEAATRSDLFSAAPVHVVPREPVPVSAAPGAVRRRALKPARAEEPPPVPLRLVPASDATRRAVDATLAAHGESR